MYVDSYFEGTLEVAPFAGAWIEMHMLPDFLQSILSLPSRERGLKLCTRIWQDPVSTVAPFAGAWIEISPNILIVRGIIRRSLRGSVD